MRNGREIPAARFYPRHREERQPERDESAKPLSYRLNQNPEERRARNRARHAATVATARAPATNRRPLDEHRAPAVSVPTGEVMRTYEFLPCGRNKALGFEKPTERKRPRKSPSYGMQTATGSAAIPSPATATSGERGRPKSTPRARARDRTAPQIAEDAPRIVPHPRQGNLYPWESRRPCARRERRFPASRDWMHAARANPIPYRRHVPELRKAPPPASGG